MNLSLRKPRPINKSLTPILEGWAYDPSGITVRRVTEENGESQIQMRLDMGVLQMVESGRPDGMQPGGFESLLALHEDELQKYQEKHGRDSGFTISSQECEGLQTEATQYYYRYLSAYHLGENAMTIRDTEHNLRLFDLVKNYGATEEDKKILEPTRPYLLMMNTKANVCIFLIKRDYPQALEIIKQGTERLESYLCDTNQEEKIETSRERRFLQDWADQIRSHTALK